MELFLTNTYFLQSVNKACWSAGSNYARTDIGNKLNYLEPNCLKQLDFEIGANASRMVTVLITNKLTDIANLAGEVGRNSIPDRTVFLEAAGIQRISDEVATFFSTSYQTIDFKDYAKIITEAVLSRLCHVFNCCFMS